MDDTMLYDETLLSLDDAGKALPNRPAKTTIWRWCRKGIRGIRLEYRRVGRRIFTSREALERFSRQLAEADPVPVAVDAPRAALPRPGQREKAIQQAERELELAGI